MFMNSVVGPPSSGQRPTKLRAVTVSCLLTVTLPTFDSNCLVATALMAHAYPQLNLPLTTLFHLQDGKDGKVPFGVMTLYVAQRTWQEMSNDPMLVKDHMEWAKWWFSTPRKDWATERTRLSNFVNNHPDAFELPNERQHHG